MTRLTAGAGAVSCQLGCSLFGFCVRHRLRDECIQSVEAINQINATHLPITYQSVKSQALTNRLRSPWANFLCLANHLMRAKQFRDSKQIFLEAHY